VAGTRAALGLAAVVAVAVVVVSGGSGADPRTPPALPGLPSPFLGVAVIGSGGRAEAIDTYGDAVGRWGPGPAGRALIYNPAARQAAGTVPADTGIVARMNVDGKALPFWRADSVRQRYLPGTNVLRTVGRVGGTRAVVVRSLDGRTGARADRRWIGRARPLGPGAPGWARRMYVRSLLVLRALTDRRNGAVAAGARDGWAYVWPRDASTVAMALASAGYRTEARRIVRFLLGLDLEAAARFHGDGTPVEGRGAQGDAAGWVAAAARAVGLPATVSWQAWRNRPDYQEGSSGDYIGNAIASTAAKGRISDAYRQESARELPAREIRQGFRTPGGLLARQAGNPASGIDSAVAWAVRPFPLPPLFPLARHSLLRLVARSGRFGIVPSEDWGGGVDPWTAPTAWAAWSLAALGERRAALRLIGDLRRAATPLGTLPERVDARTGIPTSTTPLAWSHAFAILALRQLWPRTASNSHPSR
jgi:glycosyl hydrolase family 15